MTRLAKKRSSIASPIDFGERVSTIRWDQVSHDLDAQGNTAIERLFAPEECETFIHCFIVISVAG